jgi:predicted dehydrogenase
MAEFRTVVVGAGTIADAWLPPLLARGDVEIVGIAEAVAERSQVLVERYRLACGTWRNVSEAIKHTGASLVIDITPPDAHRAVAVSALEAGCDVLGEKPLAGSLADARAIVAAARASGRRHAVMQNRRFAPGMRALRRGIAAGLIGRPTFVCADRFLAAHHYGGFREEQMTSPLLLDMAVHTFDQARFVIGEHPVSVFCAEFNPAGSWYAGDAAATCTFEFADGTVFSYRGSCVSEGFPTSLDSSWRITGTRGTVLWDGAGQPSGEVAVATAAQPYSLPTQPADWPRADISADPTHHAGAINELLDSLAAGQTPETDCADNLISLAMVFAAIESGRRHAVVYIDEIAPPDRRDGRA